MTATTYTWNMEQITTRKFRGKQLPDPIYIVTDTGCWEWQGKRDLGGYGIADPRKFGHPELSTSSGKRGNQHQAKAHRISYAQNVGPIPDGMIIRHLCHNPSCVNYQHLAVGDRQDNSSDRTKAQRGLKQFCKWGHDLSDSYQYPIRRCDGTYGVHRRCKQCEKERDQKRRLSRRVAS